MFLSQNCMWLFPPRGFPCILFLLRFGQVVLFFVSFCDSRRAPAEWKEAIFFRWWCFGGKPLPVQHMPQLRLLTVNAFFLHCFAVPSRYLTLLSLWKISNKKKKKETLERREERMRKKRTIQSHFKKNTLWKHLKIVWYLYMLLLF